MTSSEQQDGELQESGQQESTKRRRWPWILAAVVVVVAVAVSGVVLFGGAGSGGSTGGRKQANVATVTVTRTDLADSRKETGKLGYGPTRKVINNSGRVVTWLPEPGTVVTRGDTLYRLDDKAVPVFYGNTPLFRPLGETGLVGRDVQVVVDNLSALGYAIGDQPAVGSRVPVPQHGDKDTSGKSGSAGTTDAGESKAGKSKTADDASQDDSESDTPEYVTVHESDAVLTPALMDAIARWQEDVGLPSTGTLLPESVAVLRGPSRVADVIATLGQQAGGPILSVSSRDKIVTVPMSAAQIGTISKGDKVTVTLPDGSEIPGTVTTISHTATKKKMPGVKGGGVQQRDVLITLDDPSATNGLKHATVHVTFTDETRSDVLAVPVDALLALAEGGYALEKPSGELVAVQTGLFAKGMVEVSGKNVHEGMRVVTTA